MSTTIKHYMLANISWNVGVWHYSKDTSILNLAAFMYLCHDTTKFLYFSCIATIEVGINYDQMIQKGVYICADYINDSTYIYRRNGIITVILVVI